MGGEGLILWGKGRMRKIVTPNLIMFALMIRLVNESIQSDWLRKNGRSRKSRLQIAAVVCLMLLGVFCFSVAGPCCSPCALVMFIPTCGDGHRPHSYQNETVFFPTSQNFLATFSVSPPLVPAAAMSRYIFVFLLPCCSDFSSPQWLQCFLVIPCYRSFS